MAVVQELIAKLGFRVDQAGLQKADNGLKSMATSAFKMFAAYQLASRAFGLITDSVKAAANLESMNAEFEVMLGNAEAAKYLVQQINQFAAVTPFETAGLVANVRLMMAFGQSANEAMSALKMLGDVAGADQERLNRLTLAYAQVSAAGKLQGQDLLQFVSAGFNPLQELSKKTGKSMAELRKEMEKGNITAAMVTEAFVQATSKGGRFFGNMEKQSTTLLGLWSTLRDNFRMMMAELGGQLVPFLKSVITAFIPMMEGIAGAYRQLGEFFALMFSGGPTALEIAAGIAAAFGTMADAIMLVGTVAMGVWSVLQGLFGGIMALVTGAIMVVTAPFAILLGVISTVEEKLGTIMRAIGLVKAGNWFTKDSANANAGAEAFMAPARFTGAMAGDSFGAAGKSWDKATGLFGMIGGSKAPDPGSKVTLTDSILKALQGNSKVVNNNVNTDVTVHAEGTMKDILTEQANSVFGTVLGLQLRAATV